MSEIDDSTLTHYDDHFAIRSLEDVPDTVDPRILTLQRRSASDVLDHPMTTKYAHHRKHTHGLTQDPSEVEPLYVFDFTLFSTRTSPQL